MRIAAFLRGINVGGRRVSGAQLRSALETIDGVEEASAFLASGNLVFEDREERRPAKLRAELEAAIEAELGFESAVFLRTRPELAELAELVPFTEAQIAASKGKPQVILYDEAPAKGARTDVLALAGDRDPLAFSARELHWLPSAGTLESDLDLKAIERLLGTGTMRTKNTINRLHTKFFTG